ncbi:MAG: hypothetical protein KAR14_12395, partial [Candidatus Aminicenantes bacterium]|nr:hypothetical protein [Candidatus Aminicenantes bacterium]
FFMYFEDVEFSRRIISNGFHLKICNESFIYHKVGKSTGGKFTKFSVYWRTRNMGVFLHRLNTNLFCRISSYVIFNLKMFFYLIRFGKISLISVQISGIIDSFKRSG